MFTFDSISVVSFAAPLFSDLLGDFLWINLFQGAKFIVHREAVLLSNNRRIIDGDIIANFSRFKMAFFDRFLVDKL